MKIGFRVVIASLALGVGCASAYSQVFDDNHSSPPVPRRINEEPRVLTSGPLAPAPEDRAMFRDFLRSKNTGLIRLMPRETYGSPPYQPKDAIKLRGNGAYYWFAELTHNNNYGSDLRLNLDFLSVGHAGLDYGALTNLGDVPLADIDLKDSRTDFLAKYKTETSEKKARAESYRFREGVTIDGVLYQSRLPLAVNSTYLMRSIVQNESDLLVAFRVVRQDTDGSAVILWKRLKRYKL